MATIAVGDIHGNLPALRDLLGQLRHEAGDDDTVAFLGDYIDRGPDSRGCIDAILEFEAEATASVVCLCGNHEDWLLRTLADFTRHSWLLGMEAFDTLRSYSPRAAQVLHEAASGAGLDLIVGRVRLPYEVFFNLMPPSHLQFLRRLTPYCMTTECLCAHGGLDPRVPRLLDQSREAFIWGGDGFPEQYDGIDTVLYGHRDNADVDGDGWPTPRTVGRTIGLDTIGHGVLTAVRLPDGRLFQSARHRLTG